MRPSIVCSLVYQLPTESRFMREVEPALQWSRTEHLLAAVVDLLASANWQRGGGKGPRPEPIDRPGSQHKDVIKGDAFDSLEAFMAWRDAEIADDLE